MTFADMGFPDPAAMVHHDRGAGSVVQDRTLEGLIYGRPPTKVDEVIPDIEGMFEASDIPMPGEDGGVALPFSLEWYAAAPERKKKREAEKQGLLDVRNDLRTSWAELVWTEIGAWKDKVAEVVAMPDPVDVTLLLAQTVHERPYDKEEIEKLRARDAFIEIERERLRGELFRVGERLERIDGTVRGKERQDVADEEARKAREKAEAIRRAKAEAQLKRNADLLLGRISQEEADKQTKEEDVTEAGAAAPEATEAAVPASPGTGTSVPRGSLSSPASVSRLPVVEYPELRGGLSQQLPPIPDPPKAPSIEG